MAEDDSLHDPTPYSELMTSIISRFKVEEVIQAAVNLIEYLTTLPFLIPASGLECPEIKVNLTSIDLRNLHYFVSYFVNRMFSSQDFLHGQLAQVRVVKIRLFSSEINLRVILSFKKVTDEEETHVVALYGTLLQNCFKLTEIVHSQEKDEKTEKFYRALNSKTNGIIEKVIGLLPATEFAQCITSLLENSIRNKNSDWLTNQSLEILCTRLRNNSSDSDYLLAMCILKQLEAVFISAKSVHSITLAAKATKLLAKSVAGSKPNDFRPILAVLPSVTETQFCAIGHTKESAFPSIVLCGAVLISEMKMAALRHLSWLLNLVLDAIPKLPQGGDFHHTYLIS